MYLVQCTCARTHVLRACVCGYDSPRMSAHVHARFGRKASLTRTCACAYVHNQMHACVCVENGDLRIATRVLLLKGMHVHVRTCARARISFFFRGDACTRAHAHVRTLICMRTQKNYMHASA